LAIVREILAYEPKRLKTSLSATLERLARMLKRRCILVLVSDFQDQGFEHALKLCALKHDVVPVMIEDPREKSLPRANAVIDVYDPETGTYSALDLRSAGVDIEKEESERTASLEKIFRTCGLEPIIVSTDKPTITPLVSFFRRRAQRSKR
jgi:hypothetical protein